MNDLLILLPFAASIWYKLIELFLSPHLLKNELEEIANMPRGYAEASSNPLESGARKIIEDRLNYVSLGTALGSASFVTLVTAASMLPKANGDISYLVLYILMLFATMAIVSFYVLLKPQFIRSNSDRVRLFVMRVVPVLVLSAFDITLAVASVKLEHHSAAIVRSTPLKTPSSDVHNQIK